MDLQDIASAEEQRFRAAAIRAQEQRAALTRGANWRIASAERCVREACGQPIPDARRQALPGVQLCVECQAHDERRRAR